VGADPAAAARPLGWANQPRGESSERGLTRMPTIPGMYVRVDVRNRKAAVTDPLAEPENAELLRRVSEVHADLFRQHCTAVDAVVRVNLSDNELATWLYWVWRELEAGHFRLVAGKKFGLEDLAAAFPKARIRRQFYDSLSYRADRDRADTASTEQVAQEMQEPG
jgi:hypothetical protein